FSFGELDRSFFRQTLREVQVVAALKQCLKLRPFNPETHFFLFQVYAGMYYWDSAVQHLREGLNQYRSKPPVRGFEEKAEAFKKRQTEFKDRVKGLEDELKRQEKELKARQNDYGGQAAIQNPQTKAALALLYPYKAAGPNANRGRGLADKALDVLLKAT